MAQSIKMPALGESVTEGTVSAWLKSVGDSVEADEAIVEVATDKVDSEVPSPIAGVILEILVDEDETVEVGTEIARIGTADEAAGGASSPAPEPASAPSTSEPAPQAGAEPTSASPSSAPPAGDITEVKMPALGESVTEGTVSAWLKSVGDSVEADEAIVEVATDKVDSEVPSPVEGYLAEILVEEDDVVEVGTVIAKISSAPAQSSTQSAPAAPASTPKPATPPTPAPAPSAPSVPTRPTPPPGPPRPVAPPMPPTPPVAPPRPAPAAPPAPPVAPASTPTADPQAAVEAAVTRAATTGTQVASAPSLPPAAGYVTPIVRKFAKEKGVDLATVEGSGVGGRIRKEDVVAAAEAAAAAALAAETAASAATVSTQAPAVSGTIEISPEAAALRGTTEKMSRLRQTIAKRMVDSLQSSAQLTTVFEVDVTRIANLRAQYKGQFEKVHGTRLTFLPFFVKAATEALAAHPQLNAIIEGNKVTYFDHENIGIAVDAPKGLMVPVIKNAGEMSIAQIAESINTLAADVRGGTIGPDQLTGSTFTITNTGSGGALFDTPVLNMPEVGIMGVGTIVRRPVVVKDIGGGESIAIRSMVYLSITYDHRLVDGADAARFLTSVKKRLEEANFLPDLQLD